ncbi:MAG TPA: isoleucine--tRNA ligase [Planctomycetes bacterium]|nr:isoleucine--tRNA ligase [Planctomycetota bacterium]
MSEQKEKAKGYRDTLNLPKTSFSMKANLVQREPQLRKEWAKKNIYGRIRKARKGAPLYILHDGPPYANGDIHMGHVINKVLKDFVVKYKTMSGFDAPYLPGWDCHGLPIEAKVAAELGDAVRQMSKPDIRKACKKYASKYVKIQSKQFQELGIFGEFDKPYLTFKPQYEAGIVEVFAELVDKGLVYKQLKPIHWSIGCETALAEAELEYKDISSPSIFVNFPVAEESVGRLVELGLIEKSEAEAAKVCFMIWTTTPWTLTANLAIAVHPHLDYTAIRYEQKKEDRRQKAEDRKQKTEVNRFVSIVATERVEAVVEAGNLEKKQYQVSEKAVRGSELEGLRYLHPFVEDNPTDKDAYMVILAEYVTTQDGTGLVHTAPGHGLEDFVSGQKYGLAVYSPVLDDGRYDDTVPDWLRGRKVLEIDSTINNHLREKGFLFAEGEISHSYPHCWRSKGPVIFRATEQWFISVDRELPGIGKSLRDLALERVAKVKWIPAWGQKRIEGMLETRPDWCISRQRSWGLPIPSLVDSDGKSLMTKESVLAVARHIGKHGSDSWFTDSPRQILGDDFELPEGFCFDDLHKEENIFDVWFESGCSWYSVCVKDAGWPVPVDLYLEGSDQHRGWFQLSLLAALGATGKEPFKNVLTHGFTVDENGMKQSKSLGNYVVAQDEVAKYGADILRLWVASVNYQEDVRCTDELIGRTQDAYRKIRNTLRYLLGNTDDFDPAMSVAYDDMFEVDKWAVQQLQKLIANVTEAYENFVYHKVFSLLYNFCTVEMSSIYMDVLKDRLYCDASDSLSRRSAQTAMYKILDSLVRMLTPILVHTAEEAWAAMKFKSQAVESVHLAKMPKVDEPIDWRGDEERWQKLMGLRDEVLRVLEGLRQEKKIASNQEASVTVYCEDEEFAGLLNEFGLEQFAALCIVSEVKLQKGAGETTVVAEKSSYAKCQRCWNLWPSVGADSKYPDLCERCVSVI